MSRTSSIKGHPAKTFYIYAARAARGFGDGFAMLALPFRQDYVTLADRGSADSP